MQKTLSVRYWRRGARSCFVDAGGAFAWSCGDRRRDCQAAQPGGAASADQRQGFDQYLAGANLGHCYGQLRRAGAAAQPPLLWPYPPGERQVAGAADCGNIRPYAHATHEYTQGREAVLQCEPSDVDAFANLARKMLEECSSLKKVAQAGISVERDVHGRHHWAKYLDDSIDDAWSCRAPQN